jgi:hypothetical protein
MYEKHIFEHYFLFLLQEFIWQNHHTINWSRGIHIFKDYHIIFIYPWFDICNFETLLEEMCLILTAFYHNQFLLQLAIY